MPRDYSVYLANVGNDPGFGSLANDGTFPALGVLALGTWLLRAMPDVEVVVRDGQVTPVEAIVDEIQRKKPDLVALSVLATSYDNALTVARAANGCGAKVVFGNDQAAQLSRRILEHRPYVDFVVGSEYGERPLELLVRALRRGDRSVGGIPDLTYREGGEIKGFDYERDKSTLSILKSPHYRAESRRDALDVFPIVDRRLYPDGHWAAYLANYVRKFARLHEGEAVTGVTTINRARGCSRANENIKCKFCDMLLDVSFSSPELFWLEVAEAHRQVGATIFYEVCDSLSSFRTFIDDLAEARPAGLGFEPRFFVYGQALDIMRRPEIVPRLKEIGVYRVNIGLESGSDATLKHLKGPYDSVKTNYEALCLLREHGIYAYGSFVLGSDAETPDTLRETVDWAKRVLGEGLLVDVSAQPVAPLPGSVYGKRMIKEGLIRGDALRSDVPWSLDELTEMYVDRFSGVSFREAVSASQEIKACAASCGVAAGGGLSAARHLRGRRPRRGRADARAVLARRPMPPRPGCGRLYLVRQRAITWGGFHNARDLGGLPAKGGRAVRFGQLIRSADLRFVTAEGWQAAYDAGVRTVVDLRNDDEVQPVTGLGLATLVGSNHVDADGEAAPPDLRRVRVALDGVEDVEFWRYLNEELLNGTPLYYRPFLERKPERVSAVIATIARAGPGGVIFHCGAGRDRTGMVALLLLAFAGVDAEAIADDYELSTEPLRALFALLGRGDGDLYEVERALAGKGVTARDAIRSTLSGFDVEAYLLRAGVTPADLGRLRARLLGLAAPRGEKQNAPFLAIRKKAPFRKGRAGAAPWF